MTRRPAGATGPRTAAGVLSVALVLAACGGDESDSRSFEEAWSVSPVASPAGPGSAEPNLAVGANRILYLSWIEPAGPDAHALRFSAWDGGAWSEPGTVATGDRWFVNWADFPSLAALEDGTLAAHWLVKSGPEPYAYDVLLSVSSDGGATWTEPARPHGDGTNTEHGFVSLVPLGDRFGVFWLDGRETGGEPRGPMTLRFATVGRDGRPQAETLVDDRVCDCCQTDAVRLEDGALLVAYRDRSDSEIRDVYVSRQDGERWSSPRAVHDDGWEIGGCPVNGPALAARGDLVACAWFTMPSPERRHVRVAFSRDGGRTFGEPIEVGGENPAGRVDVDLRDDGSALVGWLELGEPAAILLRRVTPDGAIGEPVAAAATTGARASGFPRLARVGPDTVLAWTEPGEPSRVRTALVR